MTLGKVFPANMTGNTVLLAIAAATGKMAALQRTAVVLLAFCLGVCLAAASLRNRPPGWQGRVTCMFILEALLLAVVASCICMWGPQPADSLPVLFLGGTAALAMGTQSAIVRHLHVSKLRTTIIAGTLVETLAGCFDRSGPNDVREPPRSVLAGTYAAYVLSAVAAALASRFWPRLAMFLPLLALVVLLAYRAVARRYAESSVRSAG